MGVYEIISFDAHWDKPSKVIQIYDAIKYILPPDFQDSFEVSLENFYERQRQIHKKAYELLYEDVLKIREKKIEQKVEDDPANAKKQLERELMSFFNASVDQFITKATKLYQIAADNPTLSPDDFSLSYRTYTQGAGLGKRASRTATVGTLGSFAGAAVATTGMAAFVFFTGGAGAAIAAAAIAAATYGGVAGGAGGAITGGLSASDTICSLNLFSNNIPKRLAEFCVTVIYALSHHGYGAKPEISRDQFEELLNKVQEINNGKEQELDWTKAEEGDIHNWCNETLEKLED